MHSPLKLLWRTHYILRVRSRQEFLCRCLSLLPEENCNEKVSREKCNFSCNSNSCSLLFMLFHHLDHTRDCSSTYTRLEESRLSIACPFFFSSRQPSMSHYCPATVSVCDPCCLFKRPKWCMDNDVQFWLLPFLTLFIQDLPKRNQGSEEMVFEEQKSVYRVIPRIVRLPHNALLYQSLLSSSSHLHTRAVKWDGKPVSNTLSCYHWNRKSWSSTQREVCGTFDFILGRYSFACEQWTSCVDTAISEHKTKIYIRCTKTSEIRQSVWLLNCMILLFSW